MIVSSHQANYFPYPGFFNKIFLADIFVVLDNVQFQYDITNRNKIVSSDGNWKRITVPVKRQYKFSKITDVKINNNLTWKVLNWESIYKSYNNSEFFHLYEDYFEKLYKREWEFIFELNYETILQVVTWLGIKTKILRESELNVSGASTERLVNLCKKLGADIYLSGSGGRLYLDEKLFLQNNINIQYQNYLPTKYPQHLTKSFIPNLSIIDLLANVGPDSLSVINGEKKTSIQI